MTLGRTPVTLGMRPYDPWQDPMQHRGGDTTRVIRFKSEHTYTTSFGFKDIGHEVDMEQHHVQHDVDFMLTHVANLITRARANSRFIGIYGHGQIRVSIYETRICPYVKPANLMNHP